MSHERPCAQRIIENGLLCLASLPAIVILGWQLRRWAQGLSPTFVHPNFLAHSWCPVLVRLAVIHPVVWALVLLVIGRRLCRNYGWSAGRTCEKNEHEQTDGEGLGSAGAPPSPSS